MDYSSFRRSPNVGIEAYDPLTVIRSYLGMESTPLEILKSMYEGLQHPLTRRPPVMTPYNADVLTKYGEQSNGGILSDQLGVASPYWLTPRRYDLPEEIQTRLDSLSPTTDVLPLLERLLIGKEK